MITLLTADVDKCQEFNVRRSSSASQWKLLYCMQGRPAWRWSRCKFQPSKLMKQSWHAHISKCR